LACLVPILCLIVGCSGASGLSGKWKADHDGSDLEYVTFTGTNGIVLQYGSWMDIPMTGTYTLDGAKLSATVSYKDLDGTPKNDTVVFAFSQIGDKIKLDQETYTRQG